MAEPHARHSFDAVVFDLDGVITLTASLHAWAWKAAFDDFLGSRSARPGEVLTPFDIDADYREYVNGRPRIEGVRAFLGSRGVELPLGSPDDAPSYDSMWGVGNLKQRVFLRGIDERGVEIDEDTVQLIRTLRASGIQTAVASSSKNCERILAKTGLAELFEARVDGLVSEEIGLPGKPAPDIFLEAAARLGVAPAHAVVVEDALSGVAAGRAGGFGLVIGIDRGGDRAALREHGADLVLERFAPGTVTTIDEWFEHVDARIPSILHEWDAFVQTLAGRAVALFLDYDGTLTPIADRPELASLPAEGRQALQRASERFSTSIISGRGREDVESMVGLPGIVYAGSHGFDIAVPGRDDTVFRPADWIEPRMDEIRRQLERETAGIHGVLVEDKRFSVAVHYRLVDADEIPRVAGIVEAAITGDSRLRAAGGKMVIEVRPDLDWDKGKAVACLLDVLHLGSEHVVPLYIGDDVTDEDAFSFLVGRGIGILVSESPRPTEARFRVQAPWEVWALLDRLTRLPERGDV